MTETQSNKTVTPQRELHDKGGMGMFGKLIFVGLLIILFPLLPFYFLLRLYELVTGDDRSAE